MKIRICLAGLVSLVLALADAAEAIPEGAFLQDIAVRPDGTTVYLYGVPVDGTLRVAFSTRSDPADPTTESPVRLVPRSPGAPPDQNPVFPFRLSANGRFIVGGTADTPSPDLMDPVNGLLFDTLADGALPLLVSPRQVPLIPPESAEAFGFSLAALLVDVSNAGVAVGVSGITAPGFFFVGRGIRATPDGVVEPLEPFPVFLGSLATLRSIRPARIAASGAVVGALAGLNGLGELILLDEAGLVQLSRPALGASDFVVPELLANEATRVRGRIVARGTFESLGNGILVYENALATPTFYPLALSRSLQDAALDANSFLARVFQDGTDSGGDTLLRVGGADECAAGVQVDTVLGRPLRRVEGAGVLASSPAGFRFCLEGSREGEVLIGHDLLRELAAIEGSGFAARPEVFGCLVGDNGSQASIFCQGSDFSFEQVVQFGDRARLVRRSPFELPPCGSGGMQAAFVIPMLAMLGRRGRSRR